jgi:hypothetical protein
VRIELVSSIQYPVLIEVQQLQVELYRVHGSDSIMRSICDTADGSNCEIVNCVSVRANVQ